MNSKARIAKWEQSLDEAVELIEGRRLSQALRALARLRTWQHRGGSGNANSAWHDAEILWLEGVALERARRGVQARLRWHKLAQLTIRESSKSWWLHPFCMTCATRQLPFADNWFSIAKQISPISKDEALVAGFLEEYGFTLRGPSDA